MLTSWRPIGPLASRKLWRMAFMCLARLSEVYLLQDVRLSSWSLGRWRTSISTLSPSGPKAARDLASSGWMLTFERSLKYAVPVNRMRSSGSRLKETSFHASTPRLDLRIFRTLSFIWVSGSSSWRSGFEVLRTAQGPLGWKVISPTILPVPSGLRVMSALPSKQPAARAAASSVVERIARRPMVLPPARASDPRATGPGRGTGHAI